MLQKSESPYLKFYSTNTHFFLQSNGPGTARKWGEYECDLNPLLLNTTMDFFKKMTPRPRFVFMTGTTKKT